MKAVHSPQAQVAAQSADWQKFHKRCSASIVRKGDRGSFFLWPYRAFDIHKDYIRAPYIHKASSEPIEPLMSKPSAINLFCSLISHPQELQFLQYALFYERHLSILIHEPLEHLELGYDDGKEFSGGFLLT